MTKRSLVSEMDKSVKRMLKLIEEDGDSFAKKAEMYYQKRPELISHVEEFYRMYRSLAERYDHVTGELRKNLPLDLHSQSSTISDYGSDVPSPNQRLGRRKSGTRAAGFDFFLGSGGNSDNYQREGDDSSTLTDSEPESDDSSVNNYPSLFGNGGDQGLQRKILELEIELRDVKEKLRLQEEDNVDGSSRGHKNEYSEDSFARIAEYEQELRMANEKIHNSEEEIARLNIELQKYRLSEVNFALPDSSEQKEVKTRQPEMEMEVQEESDCQERFDGMEEAVDSDCKVQALVEELRITKGRLQVSENEITSLRYELERNKSSDKIQQLQKQLESAQKDVATWKAKLNAEKREVSKLQERVTRLKTSLTDRDHEIRDLKLAVSDAEQKIFPEKAQVKAEISKLLEERIHFEQQLKDLENQGRCLEEEIRKIKAKKSEMEERLNGVIEHLKAEVNERGNAIETLNKSLDSLKTERDGLNARVSTLKADASSRDDHINQLNKQLIEAQKERIELIAESQGAQKLVQDLKSRTRELEEEVERQRVVILEGAEEKREAIRQLCFSIEHYRNGYHRLRNAVVSHKRVPVLAS
ncbi:Protein Networked (NET), actin-binding (NAB) domain containing protein [Parasponia andersonii]|uniref:Protein Networked (NET), actin-binding (NAB) domain containing protein n=1 Tax=Parasponia andersonii TaxID=3476 RepID=A0A2P5DHS0_PARAD|nr:Protein Networked (NET), actin-binding (NAB) domain containing protein [Parasponia andersonii]